MPKILKHIQSMKVLQIKEESHTIYVLSHVHVGMI